MDYLPGLDSDEKKLRLSRISYEAFLRELVKVEPSVLHFYHARTMGEWGPMLCRHLLDMKTPVVHCACIFRTATQPSRTHW